MPEVYLMQQDGAINAFATRFLRSQIVVLLADLLDACGDNDRARDMIIGHELGHIRAGHTFGHWLMLPAAFIPFVGVALSRARDVHLAIATGVPPRATRSRRSSA